MIRVACHFLIAGALCVAGQTPSLAAEFITWFRSLIPEEPLAVMDDSANHVLTLLPTTRGGEVEAFLTG